MLLEIICYRFIKKKKENFENVPSISIFSTPGVRWYTQEISRKNAVLIPNHTIQLQLFSITC